MTVTQGGTQTHDLANGLPCSNQLSYQVTHKFDFLFYYHLQMYNLTCLLYSII